MCFREVGILEYFLDELLLRERCQNPPVPLYQRGVFLLLFLELIVIDIVGIIIPDMDIIFDEESDIAVSAKEPEELGDDSFPVDFFRREEWESIREIESELSTEKAIGHISASEIFIIDTAVDKFTTEVEVLLFWVYWHRRNF